jgi:hypothetical protein
MRLCSICCCIEKLLSRSKISKLSLLLIPRNEFTGSGVDLLIKFFFFIFLINLIEPSLFNFNLVHRDGNA